MNSVNPTAEKKPMKKVLIALLLFLLCSMIGIGALIAWYDTHPRTAASISSAIMPASSVMLDNNGSAVNGMVRPKSSSEVLTDLKKSEVYVTDKLSSNIIFPSGKSGTAGSWTVENVKTNHVIIQCEVYLGNELIAKSVPIRPGQHIEKITLLKGLNVDLYDATAYVNYFNLDTQAFISKAAFKIKVTVQ